MTSRASIHAEALPSALPIHRVRFPTNVQHWDRISFLHWPVRPELLAPLLPAGVCAEVWEGSAWVGVTPFFIRVRPAGVPIVPPGAAFPETNVRTYVTGPDGRRGIWFLHMEAAARWFVLALRVLGLPYAHRSMQVSAGGDFVRYVSRRHRERSGHEIVVRPSRHLEPPTGGPLEQFLTARWDAYHRLGPLLLRTSVEHPPWVLRAGSAERCDVDGLFRALGLPPPGCLPLVHFSDGVEVRVSPPTIAS